MTPPPSITCPVCSMTSYNRNDIKAGYCGKCHMFTSAAMRLYRWALTLPDPLGPHGMAT